MNSNRNQNFPSQLIARALPLLFSLLSLLISTVGYSAPYEKSTVIVKVASQSPSIESPWEKKSVVRKQYIGTVVKNNLVLITAFAVIDSKIIEMKKIGESKLHKMKIVFVDQESNLALLSTIDPKAMKGLQPIKFGKNIPAGTRTKLLTISKNDQVIVHPATLNDVGIYKSTTSNLSLLNYLFKIQKKGLGWSEPILNKGKLVGIASGQSADYVFAIPAFVIEHFLKDHHDENYRGFPSIGIIVHSLDDGNLRTLLKADKYSGGIRVSRVLDTSPFKGILEKDDVLLEINETKISGKGAIDDRMWKKVGFQLVVNRLYAGEEIRIAFSRDGVRKTAKRRLARFNSNSFVIPYYRRTASVPHLIYGGLIFQELTLNYLQAWGDNWPNSAPSRLIHAWQYSNDPIDEGTRKIIVLNRILADEFNRGYQSLDDIRVVEVNGKKIDSLTDLKSILKNPIVSNGKQLTKISLADGYGEIVLGFDLLNAANKRIAKTYGIGPSASFFRN